MAAEPVGFLLDLAPSATLMGLLVNPANPNAEPDIKRALMAASERGQQASDRRRAADRAGHRPAPRRPATRSRRPVGPLQWGWIKPPFWRNVAQGSLWLLARRGITRDETACFAARRGTGSSGCAAGRALKWDAFRLGHILRFGMLTRLKDQRASAARFQAWASPAQAVSAEVELYDEVASKALPNLGRVRPAPTEKVSMWRSQGQSAITYPSFT
jgi:hypothetical protein